MARLRNALLVALKWKYFIPATLALAFILRLLWVLTFDARPESDFLWYYAQALHITQGNGFADGNGSIPTAYNPIGYPLFLALVFHVFGASVLAAQIANVITQTFLVFAVYLLARELFHSRIIARGAMLLMAVYPNGINYTSLIANESLYLPLYVIGCWLMLRAIRVNPWLAVPAGLCIGYSSLCKPQGLLVGFIVLLFAFKIAPKIMTFPRLALTGFALCVGLAIVIGPWVWRNYQIWGHPVFNNTMGINMYLSHSPIATGGYVVMTPEMIAALGNGNEYEVDQQARKLAKDYLLKNPHKLIILAPMRLLHLYAIDIDGIYWNNALLPARTITQLILIIIMYGLAQSFYLLIIVQTYFAIKILPQMMNRRKKRFPTVGIWICLYFTGIVLLYYGMPRYHAPMIPWMIIYAAAALTLIPWKKIPKESTDAR